MIHTKLRKSRIKQNFKQPTCTVVLSQGPGSASMLGSSPSSTGFPPEDHSRSSPGSSLLCSHSAWCDFVKRVNASNFGEKLARLTSSFKTQENV